MNESNLVSKMSEFMTALDQVKKYREILASMTDFTIIILATIAAATTHNLAMRIFTLVTPTNLGSAIIGFFTMLTIFGVGAIAAAWRVKQRVKSVKTGKWKTTLEEGAAGALKLIQELEWDNVFNSIRYAKVGFFIYGISKILVLWGVGILGVGVFNWMLEWLLHMSMDTVTMVLLALGVVLFVNRNDLRNRYDQIGGLDWLLWELRWFESEFRGANFEA